MLFHNLSISYVISDSQTHFDLVNILHAPTEKINHVNSEAKIQLQKHSTGFYLEYETWGARTQ